MLVPVGADTRPTDVLLHALFTPESAAPHIRPHFGTSFTQVRHKFGKSTIQVSAAERHKCGAQYGSRAVRSRSGGVPAVTAAHARAAPAVTQGARVTSIDGAAAHPAGQWAGAHCPSTGRSLHSTQHRGVPARALSRAVRSRSGSVPAVTAAHARAAPAVTRGARVTSIDRAAAHPAGQWAGAHCLSTGRSLHRAQRRGVPARALSRAVRSRSGSVPVVTAAHARAAPAVTRGARVTSIDGATAHPAGLGAGACPPSSAPSRHGA